MTHSLVIIAFLALFVIILVATVGRATTPAARMFASAAIAVLICAYLSWRLPQFSAFPDDLSFEAIWTWVFASIEFACLVDLLIFVLMLSRTTNRLPEADAYERRYRAMSRLQLPHVDVWIATYNEEWAILEKTLIGCKHIHWPAERLHVWVLDDGRRDWLRERCRELGVGYLRRSDNKGRKAGNHNHALRATRAPYILSLDADFVPFPQIIYRMIGFFDEPDVAIVQSPQCYYNVEPMRRNLNVQDVIPDELDMFYKVLQPSRDAWGASFYCGSSAMLRRAALDSVGGFETTTDIEDQVTAIKLIANGWQTKFLGEKLSVGLAPESSAALHDQRNRWCRGSLQILFLSYGPFGRGLSLVQRLLFLQTYWFLGTISPVVFTATPMFVWLFGWHLFPIAAHEEVFLLPITLFIGICIYLTWVSQRTWLPVISPAFQLFMAIEMVPVAITTLIKPFGKSLIRILPVTLKGSDAAGGGIDIRTFSVLAVTLATLILAMAISCIFDRTILDHPLEIVALLFWSTYTAVVLAVALRCCIEPAPDEDHWLPVQFTATALTGDDRKVKVPVRSLSLQGALCDRSSTFLPPGPVRLRLTRGCLVSGHVDPLAPTLVRFCDVPDSVRRELIRLLYTERAIHERPDFYPLPAAIGSIARHVMVA